jgi:hypothetical protein
MAVERVVMKINRPDLHEKFFGMQDEAMKDFIDRPIDYRGEWDTFVKTQSHWLEPGKRHRVTLNRIEGQGFHHGITNHYREETDDYQNAYSYRNFRFVGAKPEDIESIKIEIGGQCFDRIYPSISGDMTFGLLDALDSIPALENHGLHVDIEFTKSSTSPIAFLYDIVHQKEHFTTDRDARFPYSATQFTGTEGVTATKENNIPLYFNHPVTRIRIFSSTAILKASLVFNELAIELSTPSNGTNSFELLFDPTINFSRISAPELALTTATDGEVNVFGDNQQIMRMAMGMAGAAFSK